MERAVKSCKYITKGKCWFISEENIARLFSVSFYFRVGKLIFREL